MSALAGGAVWAGAASAVPCYSDGDIVTLEGKATRQPTHETDGSAKPALVLSLSESDLRDERGRRTNHASADFRLRSADRRHDACGERARSIVTGKLVTGNVSAYYAVPTAILSAQATRTIGTMTQP